MKIGIKIQFKNHNLYSSMLENGYKNAAELSRAVNITQSTIGHWINLKSFPRKKEIIDVLEKTLHRPFEYLFEEDLRRELSSGKHMQRKADYYFAKEARRIPFEKIPQDRLLVFDQIQTDEMPEMDRSELKDKLTECLSGLSWREENILRLGFGLDEKIGAMEIEEIAERLKISKSRVHQVMERALRRLRHPAFSRRIKEYAADFQVD